MSLSFSNVNQYGFSASPGITGIGANGFAIVGKIKPTSIAAIDNVMALCLPLTTGGDTSKNTAYLRLVTNGLIQAFINDSGTGVGAATTNTTGQVVTTGWNTVAVWFAPGPSGAIGAWSNGNWAQRGTATHSKSPTFTHVVLGAGIDYTAGNPTQDFHGLEGFMLLLNRIPTETELNLFHADETPESIWGAAIVRLYKGVNSASVGEESIAAAHLTLSASAPTYSADNPAIIYIPPPTAPDVIRHLGFDSPGFALKTGVGEQEFLVDISSTGPDSPEVSIALKESSVLKTQIIDHQVITTQTGITIVCPWDAAVLTDVNGTNVEIYIEGWADGASAISIGAITWAPIGTPTTTVPSVTGQTEASAEAELIAAGLIKGAVTSIHNAAAAGLVVSQSPVATTSVDPGTAVALVLSLGPSLATNVVGMSQVEAEAAIVAGGFVVGAITSAYHASIAAGLVVSQSPAANTALAQGGSIAFLLSNGVQPLATNVVGLLEAEAEAAILDDGFTLGAVTSDNHVSVALGRVISQSPAADSPLDAGDPIAFVVSLGPVGGGSGGGGGPTVIGSIVGSVIKSFIRVRRV